MKKLHTQAVFTVLIVLSCLTFAKTLPCPIDADIWILAGQSNMEGAGIDRKEFRPDPRIWMFNMDDTWIVALPPVHRRFESVAPVHKEIYFTQDKSCNDEKWEQSRQQSKQNPIGGVGPGYFFAKHIVEHSDRKIALIPSAHGGTTMNQWDPNLLSEGDHSLYGAMINRIRKVGGNIKGILWYQGEGDSYGGLELLYQQKMLAFIDAVRQDTGISDLPIILVQIGRYIYNTPTEEAHRAWETVRQAQRQLPALRHNVWVIPAADLSLDDMIHISYNGQRRLGKRLAETALSCVYKKQGHATPIRFKSARFTEGKMGRTAIKVEFAGVSGKLLSAGRPADFKLIVPKPISDDPLIQHNYTFSVVHCTEVDKSDPSALLLHMPIALQNKDSIQLIYGEGFNPYVNIVDEKDMAIPCFGPVLVAH